MGILFFLAAIAAGVANPFQSGTNAQLNKQLQNPLWATIFVYTAGLALLLLIQLFARQAFPEARLAVPPWWAWLGAPVSLVSTFIALTIAEKLGSGVFTGITVTASIATSVVLDHFGLIGFKQHPASPARIAGACLMVAGVWLVSRF